ncbi:MAG: FtsX-like permease family protein [Candidatus Altiarchaeales archaeon]|nr:FtsX-like permease family protein [Candidatus Altiarchaeales archaeon]MBD3417105.1 FtsX-like permease family protein [Candidatus Altiarchaeales archaeon]
MIWDYFNLAVKNITKKGVRSWLTMLGIFVGIAAVVSLVSLGQGLEDAIMDQFAQMGFDVVMIMPGSSYGQSFGSTKLTEHDEDLVMGVRGIDNMAPMLTKISKVTYRKEVEYTWVSGIPYDDRFNVFETMQGLDLIEGSIPKANEKYKVLIGYLLAEGDYFNDNPLKVGDKIVVEGREFKVAGVMGEIGNEQDDSQLLIPEETAKEIFNEEGYDVFMAKVKPGFDPAEVAEDIEERMRRDRNQDEGEEDFQVQTSEQLMESVGGILGAVQAVLVGIALISLMVGGIGIMNTMYTSVLERTQEIGVMKAIGARNRDIMLMFLVESGMLGVVGGLVGVAIGLGMSKSVEYYAEVALNTPLLKASTSPEIIFGALAFSFIVGCLSGVLPAMQASKMRPVEALRYE